MFWMQPSGIGAWARAFPTRCTRFRHHHRTWLWRTGGLLLSCPQRQPHQPPPWRQQKQQWGPAVRPSEVSQRRPPEEGQKKELEGQWEQQPQWEQQQGQEMKQGQRDKLQQT